MLRCFFLRHGDDRHVQALADNLSDLSNRYALFADGVISRTRFTLLEHQPVEHQPV